MMTKKCSVCGRELPVENFHKNSKSKDEHNSICKECKSSKDKKYREKNKDVINAKKKEYYQEHKDEILAKSAEYRETHKAEKAESDKRYAQENKEKIQQYQKEYRDTHKLSNAEYQKQYRVNNKDKLDEYKKSAHVRYTVYQRNAKNKNRNFDLSEKDFIEMSKLPCVYCGGYSDTYNNEPFNGIDRIDSNLGYSKNNCVPCCATCNRMKMDLDVNDWVGKMKQIISYYDNQSLYNFTN